MKIAQINIRSVTNKNQLIKELFRDKKLDIMCLQETWLSRDYNFLNSTNHNIYNCIRNDGYGGVTIITKNTTNAVINQIICNHIEIISINVL